VEDEPDRPRNFRNHEGRVGGVRLVGLWIPWQAAIGVLVIVIGLTALAVSRSDGQREVTFRQTSNDEVATTTTEEATTTTEPTTTTEVTTTTVEVTTTTAAPASTTTAPPPTTTTAVPPGSAEQNILGNGNYGNTGCAAWPNEWEYIATNCTGEPRGELIFSYDTRRYPATAKTNISLGVGVSYDMTYCFRIINFDTKAPVAGSERCWTRNEAQSDVRNIDEQFGPVTFPTGNARYITQVRLTRASTGEGCSMGGPGGCSGYIRYGRLNVEW
jgi:hypothetical protein